MKKSLEEINKHYEQIYFRYQTLDFQQSSHDESKHILEELTQSQREWAKAHQLEYITPLLHFPFTWCDGAPYPHLFVEEQQAFLWFDLFEEEFSRNDNKGLIQFENCISTRFSRVPSHQDRKACFWYQRGYEGETAYLVENSSWMKELISINQAALETSHSLTNWESMKHYLFLFHDHTFECIAKEHVFLPIQPSTKQVLATILDLFEKQALELKKEWEEWDRAEIENESKSMKIE